MRDIQKEIQENLDAVEAKHNVKILLAVESGSRAWGFASPDSDYDVRFIYVERPEDYLRIDTKRDVIEWQLDEVLDINGWDLKKALSAFAKGNPNILEWVESPIVYRKSAGGYAGDSCHGYTRGRDGARGMTVQGEKPHETALYRGFKHIWI